MQRHIHGPRTGRSVPANNPAPLMISDPWFYAVALPAMLLVGMSKGGLGSVGLLVVPIMAITIPPIQAAGIVLPILILSDIVAVISYRNTFDRRTLRIMLPGAMVGIALGWLTAAWVSEDHIRLVVGVVAVLFALRYWLAGARHGQPAAHARLRGGFLGMMSGFTSFLTHAGGPPYQMYVVPLRLKPRSYAGTHVMMFATVNAVKLVPFFFLGQFDATNLATSAALLPVSLPATLLGIWLVRRIDTDRFYRFIYVLMLTVGVYLIGAAVSSLVSTPA